MNNENLKKREIKSYVLRAARMTARQRRGYEELYPTTGIRYQETFLDIDTLFDKKDTIIEIGFGTGEATVEIATKNPDKGYLAIEVHKPGIGKLMSDIEEYKIQNIKVIEGDAVKVCKYMIPDKSLAGFHIFFPDPWPKKKHHKRRMIQTNFINNLLPKLRDDGYIYIATDWEDYAMHIHEVMESISGIKNKYEGFTTDIAWRPLTKFEQKGLNKSHKIFELFYIKNTI